MRQHDFSGFRAIIVDADEQFLADIDVGSNPRAAALPAGGSDVASEVIGGMQTFGV